MREWIPGRLILLPGLGATAAMLEPQSRVLGKAVMTPQWIEPQAGEALGDYAVRWGRRLRGQVKDDRPVFVGGVSAGGMVALEMAEVLRARAVFLIASCRGPTAVPERFRRVGEMVGRLPRGVVRRLVRPSLAWLALREGLDDANFGRLWRMSPQVSVEVVQWGLEAVAHWQASKRVLEPSAAVYQIHGRRDRILPVRESEADTVLTTGGHLINMTHSLTVNRYVIDRMRWHVDPEHAAWSL